jgi:hypothetical protein
MNEVLYFGDEEHLCYRSSNILGHKSTEYPGNAILTHGVSVVKPVRAVGAYPADVCMVGRYGQWKKGVLVDDAYRDTLQVLGG